MSFWKRSFRSSASIHEIKKWKQKHPNDVNEVPVKSAQFNWRIINGVELSPERQDRQHRHQTEADDHVQSVHASHNEIENEKNAGVSRVCAMPCKRRSGYQVF